MKIIIFALIALFLLVGIEESSEYGGGKKPDPRVCGDRLCSELPGGREAWESETSEKNMVKAEIAITSPLRQMAEGTTPNQVTCRPGMGMLLSSSTGAPACVSPTTYMRLVDRGWGNYDINSMMRDQQFMQGMMNNMMYHPQMMRHMINDPQMLQYMQENSQWMEMMRGGPMMGGPMMGQGMMNKYTTGCPWCPVTSGSMQQGWMMRNPHHMQGMMGYMMNDPELRQQMFEHMMNNQQFMQQLMQNQTFMHRWNP